MSQQDKFSLSFLRVNIQQTYLKKVHADVLFLFQITMLYKCFLGISKTKKLQIIIRY